MALPLSLNTVYTSASPVKSVDLVDIQAQIVGGKHGPVPITLPAALARPNDTVMTFSIDTWQMNNSTGVLAWALIGQVGSRLKSWKVYVSKGDNASHRVTAELIDYTSGSFPQGHATLDSQSNSANAPGNITLGSLGLNIPFMPGHSYKVTVSQTGGANSIVTVADCEIVLSAE